MPAAAPVMSRPTVIGETAFSPDGRPSASAGPARSIALGSVASVNETPLVVGSSWRSATDILTAAVASLNFLARTVSTALVTSSCGPTWRVWSACGVCATGRPVAMSSART